MPLCAYLGGLTLAIEPPDSATFELVWQHDATAWAFVRAADGTCGEGGLQVGEAAQLELEAAGAAFTARRIGIPELIDLAAMPPGDLALGDSARCAFALVTLAGPHGLGGDGASPTCPRRLELVRVLGRDARRQPAERADRGRARSAGGLRGVLPR